MKFLNYELSDWDESYYPNIYRIAKTDDKINFYIGFIVKNRDEYPLKYRMRCFAYLKITDPVSRDFCLEIERLYNSIYNPDNKKYPYSDQDIELAKAQIDNFINKIEFYKTMM